ncbi:MAG TPA: hypothetical protein VEC01_16105 [Noviherbaspirillum sp.]|uniref:hypothetical protein n=1 Tax=Noviherbaspirillum sp. TaxID=1926288 RepID=UPI002D402E01|nr:hypothetical protein [Noviherbaspirillum sp.]HYD96854.1 hypothetical protein [Noviherbaspirillum sp.]
MDAYVIVLNGQPVGTEPSLLGAQQKGKSFASHSRTLAIEQLIPMQEIRKWAYDKERGAWADTPEIRPLESRPWA